MEAKFIAFMKRFLPNLDYDDPMEVGGRLIDFYGLIFTAFFAVIGLIWVGAIANLQILIDHWPLGLFILAIDLYFRNYPFFLVFKITEEQTGDIGGGLNYVVIGSAVWLLGPTGLMLPLIITLFTRTYTIVHIRRHQRRFSTVWLNYARNFTTAIAIDTFFALVALQIYLWAGGTFPVDELHLSSMILPAAIGLFWTVFNLVAYLPIYLTVHFYSYLRTEGRQSLPIFLRTLFTALIDAIMVIFSILAAALYPIGNGEFYVFNISGFILVAYVANKLSKAVEHNRRRTVEAERLEQLSQALLDSTPDGSELATVIQSKVTTLISQSRLEVRLFPNTILAHTVTDNEWDIDPVAWTWLQNNPQPTTVEYGHTTSWSTDATPSPTSIALVPILDRDTNNGIGGVYVELFQMGFAVNTRPAHILPTVQSLAHQIETALHSAKVYRETLELQKAAQELEIAGKIQSSFLPTDIPQISGWDIAATILPARQTSGDFYDFVPLDNGNIGILVADVADKGTGAALYMALSRTLIRTYAMQFPDAPEAVLREANERILLDTKSDQFVTVFYAVLKADSGELVYANAGHNPTILVCENGETQLLSKTGVPLGMFDGLKWKQNAIQLSKGDVLVLYTDGASEAQNADLDEFGEARIIDIVTEQRENSAEDVQHALMEAIQGFVADAPQFDDITLMIAGRY